MKKKQHPSMNRALEVLLKRKLEVKRYPIVAKMTLNKARPDIVSLLQVANKGEERLPARLRTFLERERFWDPETVRLTDKGQQVLETGSVEQQERGLYHIWYTNNDPLLGTRPILVQRYSAFNEPKHNIWKKGVDAIHSGFAVNTNCEVHIINDQLDAQKNSPSSEQVTVTSITPEVLCSAEKTVHLGFEWNLGDKHSALFLKGSLEALNFQGKKAKELLYDLDIKIEDFQGDLVGVLDSIAKQFGGNWDAIAKRVSAPLEAIIDHPQAIQKLEFDAKTMSCLETPYGQFDKVQCQHIPIKPQDLSDAQQWHRHWLIDFYSKKYTGESEAYRQQSRWLDRAGMNDFDLPLKSGHELLGSFEREKSSEAYWHVAAMMDLSPANSQKQSLPITLMQSDELNLEALFHKLTHGQQVQKIIYSDRYVHTARQSRNLNVIADKSSASEGILMTLAPPVGKSEAQLPKNWQRQTFIKDSNNHGRYWILLGSCQLWCWECSSGIDFFREQGNTYTVDGTPTFTPKEESDLPRYLRDAINKLKMEAVS